MIKLKSKTLSMEFSSETGALTGLDAASGWSIIGRPGQGLSFRLMVPLPGRRNNNVYGERQKAPSLSVSPDGAMLKIVWDKVISEHGGELDITVTQSVAVSGRQAVFSLEIENNSGYVVENVYFPYLGNVQRPVGTERFRLFSSCYSAAEEWELWPKYHNTRGYYGVDFPTQYGGGAGAWTVPSSPYALLLGGGEGLYIGVAEQSSEFIAWNTELRPGYGSSIDRRVPETPGSDTRVAAVHVPYIMPGESRKLTPVSLEAFTGGWQRGADIYIGIRDAVWNMKTAPVPKWAQEPHAWHQVHINSPEDELRMRYADLPKLGEDCARHGVKAIQLVGWNDGGQDQGNPSHSHDPRLGTREELIDAIKKIQAMGVRLILFVKFTWADRATEWFRKDLTRLAVKDPYGDYYVYPGYQYQTATQLLDINTKRLIPMCFSSDEYLDICSREFRKVLDLGADGILFDENLHHGQAFLCHDGAHGHRYGVPVYQNDRKLIRNFRRFLPGGSDYLFAGEACYDWEFEEYSFSYHRSESKTHIPLSRYMQPHIPLATAVTGFDDRNMINQCLMYRYVISYEPYNFKGRLDDFPLTVEYGKKMDMLRTQLREYFWDGTFRHETGASVTRPDGAAHTPYSVFAHSADRSKSGLVICNYGEKDPVTVFAALESGETLRRYRLVDEGTWLPCAPGITIPPCSAAVAIG